MAACPFCSKFQTCDRCRRQAIMPPPAQPREVVFAPAPRRIRSHAHTMTPAYKRYQEVSTGQMTRLIKEDLGKL